MATYSQTTLDGISAALLMKLWGTNAALSSSQDAQEAFVTYAITGNNSLIQDLVSNYSSALNSTIPSDVNGPVGTYIVAAKAFDESVVSHPSDFEFGDYLISQAYINYNQKSMHEPASSRNLVLLPKKVVVNGVSVEKGFVNFSKHGPKSYNSTNITAVTYLPRSL